MTGNAIPDTTIDHALILVHDLEASRQTYERLGFFVTDRGVHTKSLGTANHCIILGDDYLELLGICDPTEKNEGYRRRLDRFEGPLGFALATGDAHAAEAAFVDHGLPIGAVREYGRPIEIDGRLEEVAFRSAFIHDDPATDPILFFCQHLTPELVWRSAWQAHPNTATGIAGLTLVADDPRAECRRYQAMFAPGSTLDEEAGESGFMIGACRLQVLSHERAGRDFADAGRPDAGETRLIAIDVAVADLDRADDVLRGNDVKFDRAETAIQVAPGSASGAYLAFLSDDI